MESLDLCDYFSDMTFGDAHQVLWICGLLFWESGWLLFYVVLSKKWEAHARDWVRWICVTTEARCAYCWLALIDL